MKKYLIILVLAASVVLPFEAAAQTIDGGLGADDPRASNFQLVTCNGTTVPCDFNHLVLAFSRLLKFLLYLAIPLTLGMILYTGWLYLTANGETGQLEKAKKMFIPVLLGLFWIAASYIVVYTVIDKFVTNPNLDAIKFLDNTKK